MSKIYVYELDSNYFITGINTTEGNPNAFKHEFSHVVEELPFSIEEIYTTDGVPKFKVVEGELVEKVHPDTERFLAENNRIEIEAYLDETKDISGKLMDDNIVPYLTEEEKEAYTLIIQDRIILQDLLKEGENGV